MTKKQRPEDAHPIDQVPLTVNSLQRIFWVFYANEPESIHEYHGAVFRVCPPGCGAGGIAA